MHDLNRSPTKDCGNDINNSMVNEMSDYGITWKDCGKALDYLKNNDTNRCRA